MLLAMLSGSGRGGSAWSVVEPNFGGSDFMMNAHFLRIGLFHVV